MVPGCHTPQPISNWHKNRTQRSGLVSKCKDCRKAGSRADHLRRTFGITVEEHDLLLAEQGGVCAVCGDDNPTHTDHDHVSGRVRGCSVDDATSGSGCSSTIRCGWRRPWHIWSGHSCTRIPPWCEIDCGGCSRRRGKPAANPAAHLSLSRDRVAAWISPTARRFPRRTSRLATPHSATSSPCKRPTCCQASGRRLPEEAR